MNFKSQVKIFLLFTFLSLILFWAVFLGKVNLNGNLLVSFYAPYGENLPFKNTGWDALRIYFPFYKVTLDAIKSGQIPLWNPYAFSGHPHMADFQTAVFYPLNVFGLLLPQIEFWHLMRITPSILAAFFMFLYLRNINPRNVILGSETTPESVVKKDSGQALRLRSGQLKGSEPYRTARMTSKSGGFSTLASIFGAITFGFSPFILTWGEEVVMSPHSVVWLPLILYAIERFLQSRSAQRSNQAHSGIVSGRLYLAIIVLSTSFSLFGGYMQTSIYMFIFVFAYLVFRLWQESRSRFGEILRNGIAVSSAFVLGAGIAAVQLLPSAELYFNAARSDIALREKLFDFLLPFESLLTYLAPDFFGHPATANFFRRGDAQYYEGILFVGIAAIIFALYAVLSYLSHPWSARESGVQSRIVPRGSKAQSGIENGVGSERRLVAFMAIFGLIALLTTLDLPTSKLFLSLPIPFLSTSIPNRVLFIPFFCLAVLAAGGFDRWLRKNFELRTAKFEIIKPIMVIAGMYGGILVTLALVKIIGFEYFVHKQFTTDVNWMISVRNLVIPLVVFAATVVLIATSVLHRLSRQTVAILVIAISFLHIFYFSQKYFSFSDRDKIFPENETLRFIKDNQGYFRSWGVGEAFLENNFASQYSLFWPEGYDSLNNRSYGEFTYAMQGANIGDFVFRADAGIGRGQTKELIENSDRRRLIDLVGVKYVIGETEDEEILEKYDFKKVFDPPSHKASEGLPRRFTLKGKYAVFQNLTVMPRAFLASNYEGPPPLRPFDFAQGFAGQADKDIEKERRKLIFNKLLDPDFDWRNVLVLEKPSPISAQFGEGSADIITYKPTEVVINTKSNQPKLLFLSDNYFPGWKATVDGDETQIWRADYTFRAVPLIAGEHTVRFYYDSWVFKAGLIISSVSLLFLVVFLLKPKFLIFNKN